MERDNFWSKLGKYVELSKDRKNGPFVKVPMWLLFFQIYKGVFNMEEELKYSTDYNPVL